MRFRPSRRALVRLALVAVGLVLGILAAEAAARVVRPDAAADLLFNAPGNVPTGMYLNDAELGWSPAPGFSGTIRSLGYTVPMRFNSLGLRGGEPTAKGGWLVLGDSFTLAAQVPEEQSFVGRLAAGRPAWNGGVDGYSTWHSRIRYRRVVERLDPVGVLQVYFLGNDPTDDERFANGIFLDPRRKAGEPMVVSTGSPIATFFARRSFLYGQLRVWNTRRSYSAGSGPSAERWRRELSVFTTSGQAELRTLLARGSAKALRALRDDLRARGDQLVVAIAPPAFVVDDARRAATFSLVGLDPATADVDAPARAVAAELAQLGVRACDLTGALRAAKTGPLYFTYDGHWTAAGHAVVSEALASCLR